MTVGYNEGDEQRMRIPLQLAKYKNLLGYTQNIIEETDDRNSARYPQFQLSIMAGFSRTATIIIP